MTRWPLLAVLALAGCTLSVTPNKQVIVPVSAENATIIAAKGATVIVAPPAPEPTAPGMPSAPVEKPKFRPSPPVTGTARLADPPYTFSGRGPQSLGPMAFKFGNVEFSGTFRPDAAIVAAGVKIPQFRASFRHWYTSETDAARAADQQSVLMGGGFADGAESEVKITGFYRLPYTADYYLFVEADGAWEFTVSEFRPSPAPSPVRSNAGATP